MATAKIQAPVKATLTKNLLERVQAFANLRFPPVITAIQAETRQDEIDSATMEQMLALVIFFMGEIQEEDAVEFI